MIPTRPQNAAGAIRKTLGASEPAEKHTRGQAPEVNAWAGTPERGLCNVPLGFRCSRDPLDGGSVGAFLSRPAEHRGEAAVAAGVRAWLRDVAR